MKLGQLIEYNNRNIFPQWLCRTWGSETNYRPIFIFWKYLTIDKSKSAA